MSRIPIWIENLLQSDVLIRYKFKMSQDFLRHSRSMQFREGEKTEKGNWRWLYYAVFDCNVRYDVRFEKKLYRCTCDFFKHKGICSHIFAVCQETRAWPVSRSILES
ncbi:MAG: SWIM zinc finger family protein [Candidatus Thorarchaeota archaeon]